MPAEAYQQGAGGFKELYGRWGKAEADPAGQDQATG